MLLTIQWCFTIFVILGVFLYSFLEIRKYKKQKRIINELKNIVF